jgi:hypothetical protein
MEIVGDQSTSEPGIPTTGRSASHVGGAETTATVTHVEFALDVRYERLLAFDDAGAVSVVHTDGW